VAGKKGLSFINDPFKVIERALDGHF